LKHLSDFAKMQPVRDPTTLDGTTLGDPREGLTSRSFVGGSSFDRRDTPAVRHDVLPDWPMRMVVAAIPVPAHLVEDAG
jgi:hypothetical protein